ncbi:HBS1 protein [Tropilaelaps mercedesae]|uniref:HBS1 protein n=1 Tax=Tropilaelaps mercedesae TaxID=418985 RepID=A0A1V9XC34_9ACAR|nr:HBS1 protein [Tropilaelaps mercedesae]
MYTYSRGRLQSMSKIWEPHNPPVKEEDEEELAYFPEDDVIDTGQVAEADRPKLFDCLDKMRMVIGDSVSESILREAAKSQNFDPEKALEIVLGRISENDKVDLASSIYGVTAETHLSQQGK